MTNGYKPLAEKEVMFAQMLMQVLQDNDIPCTALPVHGVGFALKTGTQDRLNVYVPADRLEQASLLVKELFSGEYAEESVDEEEVR